MSELSWNGWIDYFLRALRHTRSACFYDWGCRIKNAANILETISNMNLDRIANSSRQGAEDFIVKYICVHKYGATKAKIDAAAFT